MALAALVVASAFVHALWNALVRLEPDKDSAIVAVMATSAASAALVAVVQAALGTAPLPTAAAAGWGALAGLAEGGYFAALARGLTIGPLGTVYTVSRGGAIALVWPVSLLWLGEPLTAASAAGTVVVVAGLAAIGLERGASRAAVGWALAAAVCIAVYHVAYKLGLAAGASPAGVFTLSLTVASVCNLLRYARRGLRARSERLPRLIVIGLLCAASFLLFLIALARGGAGYVLTLRNTSVLFAIGMAWAIGDRPGARQLVGAALVAAGAVLLGLGR